MPPPRFACPFLATIAVPLPLPQWTIQLLRSSVTFHPWALVRAQMPVRRDLWLSLKTRSPEMAASFWAPPAHLVSPIVISELVARFPPHKGWRWKAASAGDGGSPQNDGMVQADRTVLSGRAYDRTVFGRLYARSLLRALRIIQQVPRIPLAAPPELHAGPPFMPLSVTRTHAARPIRTR